MSYSYQNLLQHIAHSTGPSLTMSYEEIERVLGRPLPPSARKESVKRQWWANTDTHSQAKAWLANGRKAKLDVRNNAVTFYRESAPQPISAAEGSTGSQPDIRLLLSALHPSAIRLVDDYVDERGVDRAQAIADLLNQAALKRRRETLDWFARNTSMSTESSADLIRADRDGR